MNFYNYGNKSIFKSALISGTFESVSILHSAHCIARLNTVAWIPWLASTMQNIRTFKSTTNKIPFEYALINMIVKFHLLSSHSTNLNGNLRFY